MLLVFSESTHNAIVARRLLISIISILHRCFTPFPMINRESNEISTYPFHLEFQIFILHQPLQNRMSLSSSTPRHECCPSASA